MMVVADGDDGQSRSCAKPCPCRELVSADVRRLLIRRHLLDSWYQRSSKSCIDCSDEKISPSGLNSHGARRPVISSSSSAIYAPRECSSVQVSLNKQPRRPVRRMLWSNVTPAAAMTRHDSGEWRKTIFGCERMHELFYYTKYDWWYIDIINLTKRLN